MDWTSQFIIQVSLYFKHSLHVIKILITVSFTNCYCYKNECKNNIFSGNKLYSHSFFLSFLFKSQKRNLGCLSLVEKQSLKKPFHTRASPFLQLSTWFRKHRLGPLLPWSHRVFLCINSSIVATVFQDSKMMNWKLVWS